MVDIISNTPIEILGLIGGICFALLVLGYIYKSAFPMSFIWFTTGIIFLLIFALTNTISIGQLQVNQTYNNVTDAIINGYEPNTYPIKVYDDINEEYTLEPNFIGIMLIVLCLACIMVGILIEKT